MLKAASVAPKNFWEWEVVPIQHRKSKVMVLCRHLIKNEW